MPILKIGSSIVNNVRTGFAEAGLHGLKNQRNLFTSVADSVSLSSKKSTESFFDMAKKRIKKAVKGLFKQENKAKKTELPKKPKTVKPKTVKQKKAEISDFNRVKKQTPKVKSNVPSSISKKLSGLKDAVSVLFSREGLKAAHAYLDTVIKTTVKRQAEFVKNTVFRNYITNKADYTNCEKQLAEAAKNYYKAVKKGDKVGIMFAKSQLLDAKTSFEIAEKYYKLSESSYRAMAA